MAARELLYFDDLQPGQQFVTDSYTVQEADILRFAREFDPQPFHLDHDAARESLFGGMAASGWHTASIMMRLMVETGPALAWGIIGVGGELAWKRPVRPGDTLHVRSEVVELIPSTSRADRGIAVIRNDTRNQNQETVQTFVAKVIVPRRQG